MFKRGTPENSDYHVHTTYCGHARGTIDEYVESAIACGLSEICFTDHLGRYYLSDSERERYYDWGMSEYDISSYISDVTGAQRRYKDKISIKIGMEVDFIEGAENMVRNIIDVYPLDFVLGSIHCIPSLGLKHLHNYSGEDEEALLSEYFSTATALMESKLFDSFAHPDAIFRYAQFSEQHIPIVQECIGKLVDNARENDCLLELNGNSFIRRNECSIGQFNAYDFFIETLKNNSVAVSIGSDAHCPEDVGRGVLEYSKQ